MQKLRVWAHIAQRKVCEVAGSSKEQEENDGTQRCDDCMRKAEELLKAQQRQNLQNICKRARA